MRIGSWDCTLPDVKPRSSFQSMKPIGIGSATVEHPDSYLSRLTNLYWIKKSVFINTELHRICKEMDNQDNVIPNVLIRNYSRDIFRMITGDHCNASLLTDALAIISCIDNAYVMTTSTIFDLTLDDSILRSSKAWCSECYQEWKTAGQTVYEPLLWQVECVDVCGIHKKKLDELCPSCNSPVQFTDVCITPGYCSHCGGWLGKTASAKGSTKENTKGMKWSLGRYRIVSDLIVALSNTSIIERQSDDDIDTHCGYRDHRNVVIRKVVREYYNDDIVKFAHELNLCRTTAVAAYAGRVRLELKKIVDVCQLLDINIAELLLSGTLKQNQDNNNAAKSNFAIRYDWSAIRQDLNSILEDNLAIAPSLEEVSRRLRCKKEHLENKYPDLCEAVVRRYNKRSSSKREIRARKVRNYVRDITFWKYADDHIPYWDEIQRIVNDTILDKLGIVRHSSYPAEDKDYDDHVDMVNSVALSAWHEALHEIGIEHDSSRFSVRPNFHSQRPVTIPIKRLKRYPILKDHGPRDF